MTKKQIRNLCLEKEQELLEKYLGRLVFEAAYVQPETISGYPKELPLKIEAEYKAFLESLWKEYAPEGQKGTPLVLEERKLRELMTENDRENVEEALKEAERVTLWERITKTNYKDVANYKAQLEEYTRELFLVMREDFLEEVTEHHIKNKAFEE